ncbi:MAG: elongation factor G [Opitutales bacterium]|nr:elongation factor G [Opitutales bacterium]
MKSYEPADIRNFAIVGHQASGKTMLCEAMLLTSGKINRLGNIAEGSTVSDYHASEKERQISVHASLMHTEWLDKKCNIIDTPGYLDFISEGLGALRVGDFALVVINAASGVELGTHQVWEYATRYKIPKFIVINGLDKEHARNFDELIAELRSHFGNNIQPMNVPVNPGPQFNQVLDAMRLSVSTYAQDGSGKFDEKPAEGEWKDKARELHQQIIEYVAEGDESLMEKFFENDGLSEDDLRDGLHAAIQAETFIPVFTTSATKCVGIARLLDIIAKYGSSPVDRKIVEAVDASGTDCEVKLDSDKPCFYVWKTISEPHVGELSFFRLYSGSIQPGTELYNSDRKLNEKVGPVFAMQGHERMAVDRLGAGDIGVTVKLKDTHTGNTLCNPALALTLPKVIYPTPNIHAAIRIKNKGDEEKVGEGLSTLHEEDPTFIYRNDPEIHQTIIGGQGELHLEVIISRLKRRFGADIELMEPRIPFRETIRSKGESKYRHKKQSGGAGQFAEVWMRIEPKERDSGVEFTESLVGQNVDRVFVPSVEKGVNSACEEGILAGYKVTDIKIDFYDGKMHPVDSKDVAFQIAGKAAFKEAFMAAKPVMLEPIYNITVKVPDEFMGDVIGDISSRRGKISGMDTEGTFQAINAQVPQMELYRYSTTLRSLTGGRGMHSESFSHYEEMPRDIMQKVIKAAEDAKETK